MLATIASSADISARSVPTSRRITAALACLGVLLTLALAAATVASAEVSDPFNGVPNPSTATTEAATTTTAASSETGTTSLSSKKSLVIPLIVAIVAVLGGIAYMIVRDARSVAPVGEGGVGGRAAAEAGAMMRKRRAKAKAARRQRKRNR
jgi:hypothetical protein